MCLVWCCGIFLLRTQLLRNFLVLCFRTRLGREVSTVSTVGVIMFYLLCISATCLPFST